jgi:hypothetical protein
MIAIARHPGWKDSLFPILAGLAAAQIIGTLFVHLSNLKVYERTLAIKAAGWMAIPEGPVVASLRTMGTAFWGGLFYTLSVGAGLTLITWGLIRLGRIFFANTRYFTWGIGLAWLLLVGAVNSRGPVLFATLFTLVIPLTTYLCAHWGGGRSDASRQTPRALNQWAWSIPVLVLLALTGLWSTQLNRDLFTTIRDHILLSNAVGQKVNDFYYRYTLYAAEAFKGFHQKSIRTCRLEGIPDNVLKQRLINTLADWDVLSVDRLSDPDIVIRADGASLLMITDTGRTLSVDQNVFFKDVGSQLAVFAKASDRQAPFRRIIFLGVLLGFPVLLYIGAYGLLRVLVGLFAADRAATWWTAGLCMIIGVLLFWPMLGGRNRPLTMDQLATALQANDVNQRVVALRQVEKQKIDIDRLTDYRHLLASPWVVERYWLARVLAYSRSRTAYGDLQTLIRDPHPNVVCQAYFALGQIGLRAAIDPIKNQIAHSDHWYTQFYGYQAIRKLGWKQTQSHSTP